MALILGTSAGIGVVTLQDKGSGDGPGDDPGDDPKVIGVGTTFTYSYDIGSDDSCLIVYRITSMDDDKWSYEEKDIRILSEPEADEKYTLQTMIEAYEDALNGDLSPYFDVTIDEVVFKKIDGTEVDAHKITIEYLLGEYHNKFIAWTDGSIPSNITKLYAVQYIEEEVPREMVYLENDMCVAMAEISEKETPKTATYMFQPRNCELEKIIEERVYINETFGTMTLTKYGFDDGYVYVDPETKVFYKMDDGRGTLLLESIVY